MTAVRHYAVISVQQADTLMMEVYHQQHDLITFSVVGEVNQVNRKLDTSTSSVHITKALVLLRLTKTVLQLFGSLIHICQLT